MEKTFEDFVEEQIKVENEFLKKDKQVKIYIHRTVNEGVYHIKETSTLKHV